MVGIAAAVCKRGEWRMQNGEPAANYDSRATITNTGAPIAEARILVASMEEHVDDEGSNKKRDQCDDHRHADAGN